MQCCRSLKKQEEELKTRTHNGSRLLSLLLAVVLVFTLTVPALAADKPQDMNLRIAVMSDLHYFSPDMIANTADFEHALNSDRKLLKESSAILHEKFEQVRADKPDILLVSGDLTKDGEQECHGMDIGGTYRRISYVYH